ncbi:MAG: hypothetical protein VX834_02175 [Myxococcota bacterium]|nr:hypothetical protein [Myxococcota bacterium]
MNSFDYVIIGSGLPALVLEHFIEGASVVLIDPTPGSYKCGESIIPEHFHNLEVRSLLPRIRKLPSYTEKWGALFVTDDTVAAFPLPPNLSELSMHVARGELEALMIEAWDIRVRPERVTAVDVARKVVTTESGDYRANKQIIDCSGNAMVVAESLDEVDLLKPAHATWSYFDIKRAARWSSEELAEATGKQVLKYDATQASLLKCDLPGDWSADATTSITQVRQGVWLWQIPLFRGTMLSCGVVSRGEPVTESEYDAIVRDYRLPCFDLKARPRDDSSSFNRIYCRRNFAKRARQASTENYILVADAFAFGDPIYSVGTGLAVNKAIQVADMLNHGHGWSAEKSRWYNEQYERLIVRIEDAFEHWYNCSLISSDQVATEVQRDILQGRVFGDQIAEWYNASLRCAMGDPDTEEHHNFPQLTGIGA